MNGGVDGMQLLQCRQAMENANSGLTCEWHIGHMVLVRGISPKVGRFGLYVPGQAS